MDLVGDKDASCSSSGWTPCNYHVFLSFRGKDTRHTLVSHLDAALLGNGFRTFIDNNDIRMGENISSELEKAILEKVKSSIIVFSKNYASSKWCLDELVMILQHNKISGHKILPVFYYVRPTDVRNQTESFAEAFDRHEERIEKETDEMKKEHLKNKLKEWKEALKQVGYLKGPVLEPGENESEFVQEIVKEIMKIVNRRLLYVGPHIVGMESRVKDITSWLEDDSTNVNILVIHGTGGVGKSTIAKYVHNVYKLNSERFEACSFLENVRDKSKQSDGLVKLQKQLLSDISRRKNEEICSVAEGIMRIGEVISCIKVLVLIDDVEEEYELEAIIAMHGCFPSKSKIILTTRRQDLLKANKRYKMHEVQRLDDDESLKLFSWHAFGQDHPIEGYINSSEEVVEYCGGNPLALRALGSSLGTNSKGWERSWESTLQKLKAIPNPDIQKCLKISYEMLPDDNIKNMFLHIACFFIGKHAQRFAVRILDACGFYTQDGMKILINRSLLNIDEDNKLTMHQLLRDMGREIVRQESPDELGQRSRLWRHEDSFKVLKDEIGTEKIKGLLLDMPIKEDKHCNRSLRAPNTKRKHSEECADNASLADQGNSWKRLRLGLLSWFPINMVIRNSDHEELKADAFVRMRNLALLQLNNAEIKGKYKDFPKELKWLCWHGFSLKSLPSDFPVESLVVLDLRYSSLKQLWKGTKMLNSLKILNLGHCQVLDNSPDFLQFPHLEELILKDCVKLGGLDESIGKLENLLLLNLRGCKNLRQLPSGICEMKSLIVLILSGCSRLDSLPLNLEKMEYLRVLHADGINQSYSTRGEVKPWHKHIWSRESKLTSPESFHFSLASLPRFIVSLSFAECNLSSDCIPRNLFTMHTLRELNLSKNPIRILPELPLSLRHLDVTGCSILEMLTNLPNLSSKLLFYASGCEKLVEVQGLLKLAPVKNIDSEMVEELGLAKLDSNGMLQVQLTNHLTITNQHKAPVLQGLDECGIYSIFLRSWSVIPDWFDQKSRGGSRLSFTVPSSLPNLKIRGLNICVVFESYNKPFNEFHTDYIVVNNETRNLTVIYTPILKSCDVGDEDLMWLSEWKIANQLMGAGNKVNVWIANRMPQKVKEFGIRIVCDGNPTTCHQDVHLELSDYEIIKGVYLLCTEHLYMGSGGGDDWPGMMGSQDSSEQSTRLGDSDDESDLAAEEFGESDDESDDEFDFVDCVDNVEVAYNGDDCAFLKQIGSVLRYHTQGRLEQTFLAERFYAP